MATHVYESQWSRFGADRYLRVEDSDASSSGTTSLKVIGCTHRVGRSRAFTGRVLRREVQCVIRDKGKALLDSLKGADPSNWTAHLYEGTDQTGALLFQGRPFEFYPAFDFLDDDPVISVRFHDGIPDLKNQDWTESGRQTLIEQIGGIAPFSLPVRLYMGWTHSTADTPLAESVRWRAEHVKIGRDDVSEYDALMQILGDWDLQIYQREGKWYVMNPGARTGTQSWAEYDGGTVTTGSENLTESLSRGWVLLKNDQETSRKENTLEPFSSLAVIHNYYQEPLQNEDFRLHDTATNEFDGWDGTGLGSTSASLSYTVRLDSTTSQTLKQAAFRPWSRGVNENTIVLKTKIKSDSSWSPPGGFTIIRYEVGRVEYLALDGTIYYWDNVNSTWTTTQTYIKESTPPGAGSTKEDTFTFTLTPPSGANGGVFRAVLARRTSYLVDGSSTGDDDLEWIESKEFSDEYSWDIQSQQATITSRSGPIGTDETHDLTLNRGRMDNPYAGVVEIKKSGSWTRDDGAWTLNGQTANSIHEVRCEGAHTYRARSLAIRRGLISPTDSFDIHHTLDDDNREWIPDHLEVDEVTGETHLEVVERRRDL